MKTFSQWFSTLLICIAVPACAMANASSSSAGMEASWVTYYTKTAETNGERLASRKHGDIANEAVQREAVRLSAPGQFVSWKVSKAANAIVLRHCIPDAATGNGIESSLSLLVNGQFRQKLALSSHHAWLYGNDANPQDNDPAKGPPHHFFDETRAFIKGAPLKAGDSISLRKGPDDDAPWYVVDLIDLEQVASPGSKPAGYLSVSDFGAKPDDNLDDTAAFKECIAKAKAEGKGVWIPAGTFHQSEIYNVSEIKIRGAGPWHTRMTTLQMSTPAMGFAGNSGFRLTGKNVEVSDLMIEGVAVQRPGPRQRGFVGGAEHFLIDNVWVEHTDTGVWLGPCSEGVIRNCRFRDTYADGVNINNHSLNVRIEGNHARGNGDDGFAVFACTDKKGAEGTCANIALRHNTAEGQWWGNGIGLYGGDNIVAEENRISGINQCSGICVSSGFDAWPAHETRLSGNLVVDSGGSAYGQAWPALLIYLPGKDISGLLVQGNTFEKATNDGVKIHGLKDRGALSATLAENRIESPGANGVLILGTTTGSLTLKGNRFSGIPAGASELLNKAPAAQFKVVTEGK